MPCLLSTRLSALSASALGSIVSPPPEPIRAKWSSSSPDKAVIASRMVSLFVLNTSTVTSIAIIKSRQRCSSGCSSWSSVIELRSILQISVLASVSSITRCCVTVQYPASRVPYWSPWRGLLSCLPASRLNTLILSCSICQLADSNAISLSERFCLSNSSFKAVSFLACSSTRSALSTL